MSRDEARSPMVPTLAATRGVKGHRPVVGTRDCEDLLYVFAVVNLAAAAVHANTLDSPKGAKQKTGKSKTRRTREAFAAHVRHVGRAYPAADHERVALVIDRGPRHRAKAADAAPRDSPHLGFYRPPAYSPHPNPVGRFRKKLRRRATHDRLVDTLADLKSSVRASMCDFQTVPHKVKSLMEGQPRREASK